MFFNPVDGFYVSPSADLIPNSDVQIGPAFYSAESGDRSLSGRRADYRNISWAIEKYYSATNKMSFSDLLNEVERDSEPRYV